MWIIRGVHGELLCVYVFPDPSTNPPICSELGEGRWKLTVGNAAETLLLPENDPKQFDYFFIDAEHTAGGCVHDHEFFYPVCLR